MENTGWIKLHRKLLENPIMAKPNYLAIWIYLLINANYEDKEIIWNNQKTIIKRGQFIGSIRKISEYYDISIATVSYILKYLKVEQMIEHSSTKRFTLFTIINYDLYQELVEQSFEIKVKSKLNQIETTKNNNNIKEYNSINTITVKTEKVNKSDPSINELIEYLKLKAEITTIDGKQNVNRMRARNLLQRLKKEYPDEDPLYLAKSLIDIALADQFLSSSCTSIIWLFYNYNKVIARFKTFKQKNTVYKV